jgi:hypothetical protein
MTVTDLLSRHCPPRAQARFPAGQRAVTIIPWTIPDAAAILSRSVRFRSILAHFIADGSEDDDRGYNRNRDSMTYSPSVRAPLSLLSRSTLTLYSPRVKRMDRSGLSSESARNQACREIPESGRKWVRIPSIRLDVQ